MEFGWFDYGDSRLSHRHSSDKAVGHPGQLNSSTVEQCLLYGMFSLKCLTPDLNHLSFQVRLQHFRDLHRAIGLLVILQNRRHRAPNR